MIFSSNLFLFAFLPVFLIVYLLIRKDYKNTWLLVASIFFYAWGEARFTIVVSVVLFIDFFLVKYIHVFQDRNSIRKSLLAFSLIMKIGLLCYFKYSNFFVENISIAVESFGSDPILWTKIILPIGVSFFTFQSISYSVDVYRGTSKPLNSVQDYFLYILLFPQLIAGPIVRYNDIASEIIDREHNETIDNRLSGFYRFVIGLSKKVLIANLLGLEADTIFSSDISTIHSGTAWLGALCYTFQIYFDFSGYSDMAIGIGKMIGFKFPENFDSPYGSKSITEFWRKWHITLGQFMKDYLYIPLGGNRGKTYRVYINLWIVFLISGFWHGAGWNFIFWGAFHGAFLVLDRLFLFKIQDKIGKYLSVLFTFLIVMVGWVFFRTETMNVAWEYLGKMFSFNFSGKELYLENDLIATLIIALIFSFFSLIPKSEKIIAFFFKQQKYSSTSHLLLSFGSLILLFCCSIYIASSGFNPFIYFRF